MGNVQASFLLDRPRRDDKTGKGKNQGRGKEKNMMVEYIPLSIGLFLTEEIFKKGTVNLVWSGFAKQFLLLPLRRSVMFYYYWFMLGIPKACTLLKRFGWFPNA